VKSPVCVSFHTSIRELAKDFYLKDQQKQWLKPFLRKKAFFLKKALAGSDE